MRVVKGLGGASWFRRATAAPLSVAISNCYTKRHVGHYGSVFDVGLYTTDFILI